jgi:hypothetical protein
LILILILQTATIPPRVYNTRTTHASTPHMNIKTT